MAVSNIDILKTALRKDFSVKDEEVETERLNFIINDTHEPTLNSAVASIQKLKTANPQLCFTFSIEASDLKSELQVCHFLTLNRDVVSISEGWAPAATKIKFIDQLSRSLMREPVKCTQGHFFEKGRVVIWAQHNKTSNCFCGDSAHELFTAPLTSADELKVDRELKATIQRYKKELETELAERKQLVKTQAKQAEKIAAQASKIDQQQSEIAAQRSEVAAQKSKIEELESEQAQHREVLAQTTRPLIQPVLPLAGGIVKVGLKLTLLQVLPAALKAFKLIPGLSAIIGVGLCAYRCSQIWKRYQSQPENFWVYIWKNEKLEIAKSFGELASGGVAFIPVVGTFVSAGIDSVIAMTDGIQIWQAKKGHNDAVRELELEEVDAHEALGVPVGASNKEIDGAYRRVASVVHPDKDPDNPELQRHEEEMMKTLGQIKGKAKED